MDSSAFLPTVSSFPSNFKDGNVSNDNEKLVIELNDDMTRAVLPVTIFVGIEVFAAFFGNILVIYVFLFRYHDCNFRYFVLCLAFTDITSSLTTMPGEMLTQLYWYVYPVPHICKIKSFFNVFTVASEALCLLTIGFDRYLKVCRPLAKQMKPRHAKYICGIIFFIAFVLAIPVYFYWGTHNSQKVYKNRNITVTVCEKDEEWLDTDHPLQYSVALEIILSLCLTVMFVLYVLIAKTLLQNKKIRLRKNSLRNKCTVPSANTSSNVLETNPSQEVSDSWSTLKSRQIRGSLGRNKYGEIINDEKTIPKIQDDSMDDILQGDKSDLENRQGKGSYEEPDQNTKRKEIKIPTALRDNSCQNTNLTLQNSGHGHNLRSRVRRKTLITFILTVVFIITTILYLTLLSYIAQSILDTMSDSGKAVYFFFFRLYFINHVINPIVYGILDPHFRQVMKQIKEVRKVVACTSTEMSNCS